MKKKELGKGIRALLSDEEEKDTPVERGSLIRELSNTIAMIPLDEVEVNPYQPRSEFEEEALQQLADSIKLHGLVQPITVRHLGRGSYQIISGERRVRASRLLGLKEVPAYIRIADDQAMLEMALIENIQRQDLNPLEIAFSYQRLMTECKITHEEVADRVSKKRSTVTNYLRLLKLPPAVQQAVRDEKISMGHARTLAGLDNIGNQLRLLKLTMDSNLSVRQLESKVKNQKSSGSSTQKSSTPPSSELISLEKELSRVMGTKVDVRESGRGKGKLIIHYDDLDELQHIIEHLRSFDD